MEPVARTEAGAVPADQAQCWYTGVVKRLMPDGRYGFVQCQESHAKYGSDVFLHSSQVLAVYEGMLVTFRVQVNSRGKPQAVDLSPAGPDRPYATGGGDGELGREWQMMVTEGGASVSVPLILQSIAELTGDRAGTLLAAAAWVEMNNPDKLQQKPILLASQVAQAAAPARPPRVVLASQRFAPYGSQPGGANPNPAPASAHPAPGSHCGAGGSQRFEGYVKALKPPTPEGRPAFGFAHSDETQMLFGDDVFLHSTQAELLHVGQRISFEVQVNPKGQPQATRLEVLG